MTLDEFFAGQDKSRHLFDALFVLVQSIGPCEIKVTKSQIAFRREKAFAWAWMPEQYLHRKAAPLVLSIAFRRRDPSPRWKQVVEPAPGRFMHHLELYKVADLDEEVRAWLRKAWHNSDMSTHASPIEAFWQSYLASLPAGVEAPKQPEAWHFCDNQADADELAELVLAGVKQATASLGWSYEAENETPPKDGDLSIIINFAGEPQCIIQATQVQTLPFGEVPAEFAAAEGEGDRSLEHWRRVHWDYFSRECAQIGRTPSEAMPVVCERFRVVFQ